MREIISAIMLIASLYAGTATLKSINEVVRKAALEKAAGGLPPLPRFKK